jgi:hypothetical protein
MHVLAIRSIRAKAHAKPAIQIGRKTVYVKVYTALFTKATLKIEMGLNAKSNSTLYDLVGRTRDRTLSNNMNRHRS